MLVKTVKLNEDGSGELILQTNEGIEYKLSFDKSFPEVIFLNGQDIKVTPVGLYYKHRKIAEKQKQKIVWCISEGF